VVFYNGEKEQPDRKVLKLSDLYAVEEEEPRLELEVVLLNINQGHNKELIGRLPYSLGVCGVYRSGKEIRKGRGDRGGGRAGDQRVHKGRDLKRVLGEKPSGGEEREYL
ncbi:MAG TPA: hypothetical protein H9873_05590, partial [Candidatus Dorea gallistercoris]|nr:hypothetical protein [Candidatus Dorea gallistercoris]